MQYITTHVVSAGDQTLISASLVVLNWISDVISCLISHTELLLIETLLIMLRVDDPSGYNQYRSALFSCY